MGNVALARDRAAQARRWALISFALGLIPVVMMISILLIPAVLVPFFTLSPLY